jgi:hypothetical protein
MTSHASGSFHITLNPLPSYNSDEGVTLGRMSIDKRFHGDLEAASKGEMLSAMTDIKGSAGQLRLPSARLSRRRRSASRTVGHP